MRLLYNEIKLLMETKQPPPDMEVDTTFNEFVLDFEGELISKHFEGEGTRPNNADYFFFNRTVIAELKCLEKNYFSDLKVGEKLNVILNRSIKERLVRPLRNRGGRSETIDLPPKCAAEVFKLFSAPTKEAVEKANRQIKATKKYFGLPDAKGLLILANDGNYSIDPKMMMQVLGSLLKSRYTGLDSFIYFTPNMRAYAPQIDRQFNVWISDPSRPSSNKIDPVFLNKIQQGWISFLECKMGEEITQFHMENHKMVEDINFVK